MDFWIRTFHPDGRPKMSRQFDRFTYSFNNWVSCIQEAREEVRKVVQEGSLFKAEIALFAPTWEEPGSFVQCGIRVKIWTAQTLCDDQPSLGFKEFLYQELAAEDMKALGLVVGIERDELIANSFSVTEPLGLGSSPKQLSE